MLWLPRWPCGKESTVARVGDTSSIPGPVAGFPVCLACPSAPELAGLMASCILVSTREWVAMPSSKGLKEMLDNQNVPHLVFDGDQHGYDLICNCILHHLEKYK